MVFEIYPGRMKLADLAQLYKSPTKISLSPACRKRMQESMAVIDSVIRSGKTVYGINTGFGKLAQQKIAKEKLEELQENIVLSHAAGVGSLLDDALVRLMMVLKINALAQGYSGVRMEIVEALLALINAEIYPCVPCKGSVGASGDLAPLAHMSAALLGHGTVRHQGRLLSAPEGLKKAGLSPFRLAPKEGLALLNGTQFSTALALAGLFKIEDAFDAAIISGALSLDAAKGSAVPFRKELQEVRGQAGQIVVAEKMRKLLEGSAILSSHQNCAKVQDPYCLRCIPQVMGSCHDFMKFASEILEREANAVSDNPLVFAESGEILSGGNFHAEPVAMAADVLALVAAEIGNLSERRIAMLIDANLSGLPPFLVKEPGLHSGFMIAHVTAAALASENKQMSHPACVDSIPTSANQEDHVSMAAHGARRLLDMADNTQTIVAIELLAGAQGVDLLRPLKSSPSLEEAHRKIRDAVPFYDKDRFFAPDIAAAKDLVSSGVLRG